ncbi:MAG: hypothetical protein ACFNZJ_01185, partial [Parascardovia denticolens]
RPAGLTSPTLWKDPLVRRFSVFLRAPNVCLACVRHQVSVSIFSAEPSSPRSKDFSWNKK